MRPDRHTIGFITAVVAVVETLVILYNNATGFVPLTGIGEFLVRVGFGTLVATPLAVVLFMIDAAMIRLFDRRLPWERAFIVRLAAEVPAAALTGALLIGLLTAALHLVLPYRDGLTANLLNNALIVAPLNVIITAGLEAYAAWRRSREERERAETLERENAAIRFEVLKTQLNPHFLFNSLNVLSSLIARDGRAAQAFVDEFAAVYRYILEVIDLPVVELRRELAFARSYLYLQSIRFGDAVTVEIAVPSDLLEVQIPPLALQTVVENAFKHNRASAEAPLRLSISADGGVLTVRNNLQPRIAAGTAAGVGGIGLANLRKRYAHLGAGEPRFTLSEDAFTAALPLITPE